MKKFLKIHFLILIIYFVCGFIVLEGFASYEDHKNSGMPSLNEAGVWAYLDKGQKIAYVLEPFLMFPLAKVFLYYNPSPRHPELILLLIYLNSVLSSILIFIFPRLNSL